MAYHAKVLTETEINEIVKLYSAKPKTSINKLSAMYNCGAIQITDALDEYNIPRKRNKPQEAKGWKPNQKKPEYITVTKSTPEYFEYLCEILAQAGRLKGEAHLHFERLLKENPFKGIKRYDERKKLK